MKVKKEDVLTFDGNCFHFNKSALGRAPTSKQERAGHSVALIPPSEYHDQCDGIFVRNIV